MRIGTVRLKVRDLETVSSFYRRILGLTPIAEGKHSVTLGRPEVREQRVERLDAGAAVNALLEVRPAQRDAVVLRDARPERGHGSPRVDDHAVHVEQAGFVNHPEAPFAVSSLIVFDYTPFAIIGPD